MNKNVLSALSAIQVSELTRMEWLQIGMALKQEGFACDVWDRWSKDDCRYKPGECQKLWTGFNGSVNPVTGGTIIKLAKDRGWECKNMALEWDAEINETDQIITSKEETLILKPTQELKIYLETLFNPDEIVGYVTGDVYQTKEGRWAPLKGIYVRTAGELIQSLVDHPDDITMTVGDYQQSAGAWTRINSLDGHGVRNQNVSHYTYALIESDTLSIEDQIRLYRELQVPIKTMVYSGGKSVHIMVPVNAKDKDDYDKKVRFLYSVFEKKGIVIDKQNSNPSRLTRMPGVDRNGKHQKLIATNLGKESFDEWIEYIIEEEENSIEKNNDVTLPKIESLADALKNPPPLPKELIQGILRIGHKMLIAGSSKAAKSFLLMQLCIAITEGLYWLGFKCRQGKILYINLEIDRPSCINRFASIYNAMGIAMSNYNNIDMWNLRGYAMPLDKLVQYILVYTQNKNYSAVVIDPLYKILTGDENSATDMSRLCNEFDKICNILGCAVIYCHHHSKGSQGAKRPMDRASGSGVFARDVDALLDLIELEPDDNTDFAGATAWRIESSLREFKNIKPKNIWFKYPLHTVDTSGILDRVHPHGSYAKNFTKSPNYSTPKSRKESIETAFKACKINDEATIHAMADFLGVSDRTVRDRVKALTEYKNVNGIVTKVVKKEEGKNN